jgi:NTE family protein
MRTLATISKLWIAVLALLLGACASSPLVKTQPQAQPEVSTLPTPTPKIGLALGGGAARGFAHIGVIKVLEAHGFKPDFIAGTSAGSVVGSLYASGMNPFQLQGIAMQLKEENLTDWNILNRGVLKGEALQDFINKAVANRPIEKLPIPFGAVSTDLNTGNTVVFRSGNTGMAVRASSTIPGIFSPVSINHHEYVDGGLTEPVPAKAVREMGAEFVIAIDISKDPASNNTDGLAGELLQIFAIMEGVLNHYTLTQADVVIHPNTNHLASTGFDDRHQAILEGERAATAALPELMEKWDRARGL